MNTAEMFLDRLNRSALTLVINKAIATIEESKLNKNDSQHDGLCQVFLDSFDALKQRYQTLNLIGDVYDTISRETIRLIEDTCHQIDFSDADIIELADSEAEEIVKIFMGTLVTAYSVITQHTAEQNVHAIKHQRKLLDVVAQELGYHLDLAYRRWTFNDETENTLMLRSVHTPLDIDQYVSLDVIECNRVLNSLLGCELFSVFSTFDSYNGESFDTSSVSDVIPVKAVVVPVLQFHSIAEE